MKHPQKNRRKKTHSHAIREPVTASAFPWARLALGSLVILIVTLAVYMPAMKGQFVYDDKYWLHDNPLIDQSPTRYWYDTSQPWGRPVTLDYIPLTSTTFWVLWRTFGDNPLGYHLLNVLLHVIIAVGLWLLLRKLKIPGGWLIGLIFAVHPVNVASVAWITEMKNTLSMSLMLASMGCYLRFDDTKGAGWYVLSLAMFILAGLAKASVVVCPIVLLGCVWWRRKKLTLGDLKRSAAFFVLSLGFAAAAMWFQANRAIGQAQIAGPDHALQRLALAVRALWFYVYKALLPIRLSMIYPRWDVQDFGIVDVWPLLPILAIAAGAIIFRRGWGKAVLLAMGFYVLALAPVLGFVDMYFHANSFVADHWHYMALPGVIALVVGFGAWCVRRWPRLRIGSVIAAVAIVATLSTLTFLQAGVYRSKMTLWTATLERNPDSWTAHQNLAIVLDDENKTDQARRHYERSIELNPQGFKAHTNLGKLLQRQGDIPAATEHYRTAIAINPNYARAHSDLATILGSTGQSDQAIEHLRKARELAPHLSEPYFNLAVLLMNKGQLAEALENATIFVRLNGHDPKGRQLLDELRAATYRAGQ